MTVKDTLEDIDKIGEALEKNLGKENLEKLIDRVKNKTDPGKLPIYQLWTQYRKVWNECSICDFITYDDGEQMEDHIRAKHPEKITELWRTKK